MVEEVWKTVEGWENYQVSNLGRVKSLPRMVKCNSGYQITKEKILKPHPNNKGYLLVNLYKNGIMKTFQVHRLVGKAFIPNPDNLPQINHIDECKTNNCVDNLEFCTQQYNNTYGTRMERTNTPTRNERISQSLTNHPLKSTPVVAYKDGVEIMRFPSMMEAQRNGFDQGNISNCCNGKIKTHKGYEWKKAI